MIVTDAIDVLCEVLYGEWPALTIWSNHRSNLFAKNPRKLFKILFRTFRNSEGAQEKGSTSCGDAGESGNSVICIFEQL